MRLDREETEPNPALEEAYATYLDAHRQFAKFGAARGFYPIVALGPEANMGSGGSQHYPRPKVVATLVLPDQKAMAPSSIEANLPRARLHAFYVGHRHRLRRDLRQISQSTWLPTRPFMQRRASLPWDLIDGLDPRRWSQQHGVRPRNFHEHHHARVRPRTEDLFEMPVHGDGQDLRFWW